MQEADKKNLIDLPKEDKQKLVDTFIWLLQEDKKQNPELYKYNQKNND